VRKCNDVIVIKQRVRVVADLVPRNIPVCNECVVCIIKRGKISYFWLTAIRILSVGKKLVYGLEGIRLDSIVGSEDNELWHFRLRGDKKNYG